MSDSIVNKVIYGNCIDVLRSMPPNYVNLIITSPPYFGCRVYGDQTEGLGRESHPLTYIDHLYDIVKELHRVLREDGSMYIIIGDVYFGSKGFSRNKGTWSRKTDGHYKEHKIVKPDGRYIQEKQLLFLPERLAIKMQDSGDWLLRSDIIWEKPNPIPSHSPDRVLPVHEHILFFSKNKQYYFDYDTIKSFQRHRSVIRQGIEAYDEHQATFPESLIEPYLLATSKEQDIVLDPFGGSGTVGVVSARNKRNYVLIDVVEEYCKIAEKRIQDSYSASYNPHQTISKKTIFDSLDDTGNITQEDNHEVESESSESTMNIEQDMINCQKKEMVYSLRCSVCKQDKKTNPQQFAIQLKKSNIDKDSFMLTYKCRSCRKI